MSAGWRLRVHESLASTSDLLITLAGAGEPEGLAVLARRQTAGRGRHGRGWESPAGNLYLSVLLRPTGLVRDLPQWSLLAAVAAAEAASALLPNPAALRLKWPNDLLLDGAKCAGILVNADLGAAGGIEWLVIGFGVNLRHAPDLPDRRTASLAEYATELPEAEDFAARLLERLDHWRRLRRTDGFAPVRAAWTARGPELGTLLTVHGPAGTVAGRYDGLSDDGRLLLASGGRVHAVAAGELAG